MKRQSPAARRGPVIAIDCEGIVPEALARGLLHQGQGISQLSVHEPHGPALELLEEFSFERASALSFPHHHECKPVKTRGSLIAPHIKPLLSALKLCSPSSILLRLSCSPALAVSMPFGSWTWIVLSVPCRRHPWPVHAPNTNSHLEFFQSPCLWGHSVLTSLDFVFLVLLL